MNVLMADTFITSVVFNDEAIEITFMESGEQSSTCMEIHTIAFPIEDDPEKIIMLEQCQDLLREIIDRVYAERRAEINGQKRRDSEKRLALSSPEDDVDEV
jgi:hypothetical protein